jgi:hypothetical protein
MAGWLKQSTAVDIALGPFVDATDGVTAETALTISQADVRLKKNAAAWAQKNDANAATHEENGWYEVALNATDTDTIGILIVAVNESGALPVWREFRVLAANVYDSLVSGSDLLQVDTREVGGTTQTAGDIMADTNDIQSRLPAALVGGRIDASVGAMANNVLTAAAINADAITAAKIADGAIDAGAIADGAITAAKIATNAIDDDALSADAVTAIQSGLATAAALDTVDNFLDTEITDIQARLPAALVGGRMDSSVGAMAANVMTAAAAAADLTTELQSGLATAAALDTVDNLIDTEVAAIKAVTDQLATAMELDGAVYRFTTNALEQAPGAGSAPTAAQVADAVWDEALAGHAVAGSAGQALSAAGGAADPLLNAVPGAYAAGTAGYALGTLPQGVGAVRYTYTVYNGVVGGPLIGAGVTVWVTSDEDGDTVVAGPLITNDLSQVTFFLDVGTYYFWRQRSGWTFTNPDTEVVS